MGSQPTLFERSPTLLVHGLQKFVEGLNPVANVMGLCEFLVETARFSWDVTVGKTYLSPDAYRARINGFWGTMDALSPENLALLSAQDWVGLGATLAGGVVLGAGIYKTITCLREIEATSRVARQAAKIAGALKGAVDTILAEHPIAVTAQGVLISNYDKIEEIAEEVVAVIKSSEALIQVAGQETMLLQNAAQKIGGGANEVAKNTENILATTINSNTQYVLNTVDGRSFLEIKHPVLDNIRTSHALKPDAYHAFNDLIDNFARYAQKFNIKGGDGLPRELYQIEGSLNGKTGIFEWIVDPRVEHGVTHRFFIKNGTITGIANVY